MTESLRQEVIAIFREVAGNAPEDLEDRLDEDYLENGFIDSLDLVSFITELEERFDTRFTSNELESQQFRTLAGVAELLDGKE